MGQSFEGQGCKSVNSSMEHCVWVC